MQEIILYAIREGEARPFMQEIISTQCQTRGDIERVINEAKAAGWHSFRVATYNGELPDFIKAIQL